MWEVVALELTDDVEVIGNYDVDHAAVELTERGDNAIVAAGIERMRQGLAVLIQDTSIRLWVTIVPVLARRDVVQ